MKRVLVTFGADSRQAPYLHAVSRSGMVPILALAGSEYSLEGCNGLLLTGGTDVDPALYGQRRAPETEDPDAPRDSMERALLTEALERELPILAICRGLQFVNVYRGGTLAQHIEGHVVRGQDRSLAVHPITVAPSSLLSTIAPPEFGANSRHHQAVAKLGHGLRITGTAPDGVVEALEMDGKSWVLAVQWHPEDQPDHRFLFEAFQRAL